MTHTQHKLKGDMKKMWSQQSVLGVSRLRFLPKKTGVRPIINLQSKVKTSKGVAMPVNYQLQAAFHVLDLEKVGHK